MTTIACNRRELAVDSQCTSDGDVPFATDKLWRLDDSIIGVAGMLGPAVKFIQWRKVGGDPPRYKDEDFFNAMELCHEGIVIWDQHLVPYRVKEEEYAIGSGGLVALYCMRHRKMSPSRAVAEACKIDPYSSEPISIERLVNRKRKCST